MTKIKAVVTINVDFEKMEEENVTVEQVLDDLTILEDEVVDGFALQRRGDLGDTTMNFYLSSAAIDTIEVVGSDDSE
jgi:hypothetical protein